MTLKYFLLSISTTIVVTIVFFVDPEVTARERISSEQDDAKEFMRIETGTLPIIISAPHGGRKPLPGVLERKGLGIAKFTTVRDTNTDELAEKVSVELEKKLEGKPWLVIARFDRKYLDVNRPADSAFEMNAAKPYYDAYHAALAKACKAVKKQFDSGILLDIHGQGVFTDSICRGTQNGKTVSLLIQRHSRAAFLGEKSILGNLEQHGYPLLPKCSAPETAREEPQFSGGHIVGEYGSHQAYAIDAIQLELGTRLRERMVIAKTARDLADSVVVFHNTYLKKSF